MFSFTNERNITIAYSEGFKKNSYAQIFYSPWQISADGAMGVGGGEFLKSSFMKES